MKIIVNIFLSTYVWVGTRSKHGPSHHVKCLYEEIFKNEETAYYPDREVRSMVAEGFKCIPIVLKGKLNVITQGYPIITGALASLIKRDPGLIVHTWKVPGATNNHFTARIYDVLLRRVIDSASAVVVASLMQARQIRALGVSCPIVFAPVTTDSVFWCPDPPELDEVLTKFKLESNKYVITVGGPDRDEIYAAIVADKLGLTYVRATYDNEVAQRARMLLVEENLESNTQILMYPTDIELRALYAGALLVCLPTITRTNPAGLSSMVEAMACGSVIAVPEALAEGYVDDGVNGLVLSERPEDFAARISVPKAELKMIGRKAREHVNASLDNKVVAAQVKAQLQSEIDFR
jgi:hypothetical protein